MFRDAGARRRMYAGRRAVYIGGSAGSSTGTVGQPERAVASYNNERMLRIALCQINPIIGDLDGNVDRILSAAEQAAAQHADLAVFPELCVTGYPPLDLLEDDAFLNDVDRAIERVAAHAPANLGLLIGAPRRTDKSYGKALYNSAILIERGKILDETQKVLLPTYDIFDEARHFTSGDDCRPMEFRGMKLGVHICEDMWNVHSDAGHRPYDRYPIRELMDTGSEILINLSASPFNYGKHEQRNELISGIVKQFSVPFVLVNQVGANTDLIFDGDSRVYDAEGLRIKCAASFQEDLVLWVMGDEASECVTPHDHIEDLHDALVLGISDYFSKTGAFSKAVIGLSGGIDSAVTAALATAALGPDKVIGVTMPSRYSSPESARDAGRLAENLGIAFGEIPIEPAVTAFENMLASSFEGLPIDLTEENIQARVRGTTLMGLSNKFNYLVLSTSNKSEAAVGYATLYGDMVGGLAVLLDVYKQQIYELAHYVNRKAGREIIPDYTITRPPSAELRPDQTDQDSLPPYEILDPILECYIEKQQSVKQIVHETGSDVTLVRRVLSMVDRSEYKRFQAAPGLRVTEKAFGFGRRIPLVMRRSHT